MVSQTFLIAGPTSHADEYCVPMTEVLDARKLLRIGPRLGCSTVHHEAHLLPSINTQDIQALLIKLIG